MLLQQWKQGDEKAFEALYRRHVREVFAIAVKKVGDKNAAEDLVQDAFISLHRQRATISIDVSLRAYLYVTIKHKIYSHYRKTVTHQQYAEYVKHAVTEVDETTVHTIETRELEKLLNEEIEKLPQQCKLVFKLSRKDFLSNKEIAHHLKISENTVEQHMRRALKQLRSSLGALKLILFVMLLMK